MKSTDEQERRAAKAILADGKWSHNHYSPQQMEDLIARVINAALAAEREASDDHKRLWFEEQERSERERQHFQTQLAVLVDALVQAR